MTQSMHCTLDSVYRDKPGKESRKRHHSHHSRRDSPDDSSQSDSSSENSSSDQSSDSSYDSASSYDSSPKVKKRSRHSSGSTDIHRGHDKVKSKRERTDRSDDKHLKKKDEVKERKKEVKKKSSKRKVFKGGEFWIPLLPWLRYD